MASSLYKTILVPLDGSGLAELAAVHAAELSRLASARLVFVRVVASGKGVRQAADYLFRVNQEAHYEGLKTDGMVKKGDAAEQIVLAAAETGANMIVLSSHGRTGISRQVFGSVAEAVVRLAPCPVMVVKASPMPPDEERRVRQTA